MPLPLARRAECIRAIDRARATLKPGDRITFTSCPGTARTATFEGWDGNWIRSRTRDDIAATSITRLNGEHVSFTDPPWERGNYDPATGRAYGDHGTSLQALTWALNHYDGDATDFLREWQTGSAAEEWPEFYEWLMPWPAERMRRQSGMLAAADLDSTY